MAVFFYGCITLDGYLATKEHGLGWLYETGSLEETLHRFRLESVRQYGQFAELVYCRM